MACFDHEQTVEGGLCVEAERADAVQLAQLLAKSVSEDVELIPFHPSFAVHLDILVGAIPA